MFELQFYVMYAFLAIFLAICVVLVFHQFLIIIKTKKFNYKKYPCYGLSAVSLIRQVLTKPMHELLLNASKLWGKSFWVIGLKADIFLTADFQIAKQICVKNFHSFPHRLNFFRINDVFIDNSILLVKSPQWKVCRSAIAPVFTINQLKQMQSQIDICVENLITSIRKFAIKDDVIDFKKIFDRFTLEVIAVTAFDSSMTSKEFTDEFLFHSVKIAEHFNAGGFFIAGYFPWIYWLLGKKMFPKSTTRYFLNLVKSSIEKKQGIERGNPDLIELFMKHNDKIITKESLKRELNLEQMTSNAISFLFAGYETTSSTLCSIAFLLAKHPSYQDRLYQEIMASEEDPKALPLLNAIISESLRLYPPIPVVPRTAEKDCLIDEMMFKKETMVDISISAIHRNPEYFPDPDKFYPERFLDNSNVDAFMPFGLGPRNCIGFLFGLMELRGTVIQLVKNFFFIATKEEMTLKPGHPLLIPTSMELRVKLRTT